MASCSSRLEPDRLSVIIPPGPHANRERRQEVTLAGAARWLLLASSMVLAAVGCASGGRSAAPTVAATPGIGDATRGKAVYTSKVCIGCHQVSGEIAGGTTGPDLRGFGSRPMIAATVPNTPENLWHWLENPQRTKPGTQMPRTPATPQELDDLVAYLESLK